MKYILIAFNSRSLLYNFTKSLKFNGISFSVINTPRAISISCGLSVKISFGFYKNLMNILNSSRSSIKSVYIVENIGNSERYQKIF